MIFKPAIWHPIALGLSALNFTGAGFAMGAAEPWHAAAHVGLALVFGLWAQRLHRRSGGGEHPARLQALEADLSELREDMSELRHELAETQERMDFAERLLAQRPEPGRVGPER